MGRFIPSPVGMKTLLESPGGEVQRDLDRRGRVLLAAAIQRCPVGTTGALRKGLRVNYDGRRVELTSDQKYAEFVARGTRAHVINIRQRRVLADVKSGDVFGTRVNHPGTKPDNFAIEALKIAMR